MWPCESCHSVNAPKADRCYSCHLARGASPSFEPGPDENGARDATPAGWVGLRARTAAILGAMAVTGAMAIAGAALVLSVASVVLVESPALPAGEVAGVIFAPPAPSATVAPEPVATATPDAVSGAVSRDIHADRLERHRQGGREVHDPRWLCRDRRDHPRWEAQVHRSYARRLGRLDRSAGQRDRRLQRNRAPRGVRRPAARRLRDRCRRCLDDHLQAGRRGEGLGPVDDPHRNRRQRLSPCAAISRPGHHGADIQREEQLHRPLLLG